MWIIYDVERARKRRISNNRTRNIEFLRGLVGDTFGRSLPGMKTNNQFFHDQCPNKREVRAAHRHTRYYLLNYTNTA
jgi:hypothetical protein